MTLTLYLVLNLYRAAPTENTLTTSSTSIRRVEIKVDLIRTLKRPNHQRSKSYAIPRDVGHTSTFTSASGPSIGEADEEVREHAIASLGIAFVQNYSGWRA